METTDDKAKRRQPRAKCYAKVLAPNMTPGYIRDLSASGCQISFVQTVQADIGEVIDVQVVAGGEPQTVPFAMRVLIRWVKGDGVFFSLGGEFVDLPAGAEQNPFYRLVDYYQGKEPAS